MKVHPYDHKTAVSLAKKHKSPNPDNFLGDTGKGHNFSFKKKEHAKAFHTAVTAAGMHPDSIQSN